MQQIEPREPKVPCFFHFFVDNGNNNNLSTSAKVNYPPYGIDFPGGPTGRFCNGRTVPDFFAKSLGFKNFIPPFTTAKDEEILQGVNYASGSAGIRDETGRNLFLLNNILSDNGARKVALIGLGPLGCAPDIIAFHGTNGRFFLKEVNDAAQIFNDKLKQLVDEINEKFKDANFHFMENFGLLLQFFSPIGHSSSILKGCCDVENQTGLCLPNKAPCKHRNLHLFFDSFHPSEALNHVIATLHLPQLPSFLS
ncbi:hypothetical protein REPUB_Repub14bG0105100 [Reevesia pubescens]